MQLLSAHWHKVHQKRDDSTHDLHLVLYAEKLPATGNETAISPKACIVQYIMIPTMLNAITKLAGPPCASAFPLPTNRPVPILPPIAITVAIR